MLLPALLALGLATGPSSADYRIVPVAANARGEVLFRTWRELNPSGAHALTRAEVGWLVVSVDGLWKEVPHAVAPDGVTEADMARHEALRAELAAPFDWKAPPASVRPLLDELGFSAKDAVSPSEGAGGAVWTPARTCVGKRCTAGVVQRTLGGLESDEADGSRVVASFFKAGVALFHDAVPAEGEPSGARFTLPPNLIPTSEEGLADLGFETSAIDGIAIPGLKKASPNRPAASYPTGRLADVASPQGARALLARPFPPQERLRLLKGTREAIARTCAELLAQLADGFGPASTIEIQDAGGALIRCGGLDLFSRMRPSRESHVGADLLGAGLLDLLPPCVGGVHASAEAQEGARRASRNRVVWSRFDPEVKVAEVGAGSVVLRGPGEETTLTALAHGDLDGDGREDLLVASAARATEGTWVSQRLYALTRRAGDPQLRVVAERAVFRGSEGCPGQATP